MKEEVPKGQPIRASPRTNQVVDFARPIQAGVGILDQVIEDALPLFQENRGCSKKALA